MSKVGNVIFHSPDFAEGIIRTRTMKLNIRLYLQKDKTAKDYPDYDVRELLPDGDEVSIGGGWRHKIETGPNAGKNRISLALDDPSFPMPLNVSLFATSETEHDVVWNRPREKAA